MSRFRDAYDEFRRLNLEVAGVSVDSPYSHRAWAEELEVPFPLLSDFGRELMRAYGVPPRTMRLLPEVMSRSAFLVDAGGIVRYAWYEPESRGLPDVDPILEAGRALNAGDKSPGT